MNRYLIDVVHYFKGHETFEVDAANKQDAVQIGRRRISRESGGNYDLSSVRCIKKLKPR